MAATLHQLLQTLPQELYDRIHDLTFTPTSNATVSIANNYTPPSPLQVSAATRQSFAQSYYTSNAFHSKDCEILCSWTLTLPKHHRDLLRNITLHIPAPSDTDIDEEARNWDDLAKAQNACSRALDRLGSTLYRGGWKEAFMGVEYVLRVRVAGYDGYLTQAPFGIGVMVEWFWDEDAEAGGDGKGVVER